jgi:hypothetical protein
MSPLLVGTAEHRSRKRGDHENQRGGPIMKTTSPRSGVSMLAAIAVATLTTGQACVAFAQDKSKLPDPPYQIAGTYHVMVGVVWDEAMLKKMLPPGMKPVKELSGAFNIYQATRGYGIAPYSSVYAWADVEGYDSANGTKGRWMLAGAYGPDERVAVVLRDVMGFPVRTGTATLEETTSGRRATGMVNGNSVVVAEVKSSALPCDSVATTLNSPVQIKGKILVNQIPATGDWCGAEPISLKITAPAGDPFAALVPVKVVWAGEFRNGAFAFSRPVPKP